MKLASFQSYIVKNPPPSFGGRYFIFVTLTTSCGITGTGEIYAASFAPEIITAMASDIFQRYLEGQNPFQIEQFCRRAHGSGFSHRPDPSLQGVVSGLEIACWDIIGKALDRPIYDLLGGQVHDKLRTYTYLYPRAGQDAKRFYNDPVASAEAALSYVKQGFTAVKFDPVGQYTVLGMPDLPALDGQLLVPPSETPGDQADLLFGTHGQFTAVGAIRFAERLAPYDPLWLKPTPPDMPEEMAKVAARSPVPIATGERLCTNMNLPGCCAVGQPPFCNQIWAGPADLKPRKCRYCRNLLCANRSTPLLWADCGITNSTVTLPQISNS